MVSVCQVCVYEMYVCDCVCDGECVRGSEYNAPRGSGRTVARPHLHLWSSWVFLVEQDAGLPAGAARLSLL